MRAYQIQEDKCRSCLRCMQECPTFAVKLREGTVTMEDSLCVDCGICYRSCGHNAVRLNSQVTAVKRFLQAKRKVILSLDPACRALLPEGLPLERLAAATQKLGIWDVADASEAVAAVAAEYARLLRENRMENIILTGCPVVRNLVEQYYPELTGMLAPVASYMIAHGRMLKRDFTSAAVAYVSICGARTQEARDVRHSTEINAVLTLPQLLDWLQEEGVDWRDCEEEPLLSEAGGVGCLGAVTGGLMECVDYYAPQHDYRRLVADGMDRCMAVLEQVRQGNVHHCVLELNACAGGCVGGTAGGLSLTERFAARSRLERQLEQEGREPYFDTKGIAMANPAIARRVPAVEISEDQIQEMLYHIGVGNPRQQKNCGACGYETCRARAQAILEHKENVSLCRQVVQEAKQDVYSVLYEHLPMAAILVDETQKVVGLNQEASSLFSIRPEQEKYIFELMDPVDFQYVLDTGLPIKNRRMDIPEIFMRVEANLVPLKELNMVLGLFQDITEQEEEEAKLQRSRLQSVEMAQKVIEKQMTVAQQIAFLLGETTAETKVTLNQIKQRILGEEDAP